MYSLTSTVSPLYFLFLFQNFSLSLSLSLSPLSHTHTHTHRDTQTRTHVEWYIRIPQIEDNIQFYQWATHCKDCLLR